MIGRRNARLFWGRIAWNLLPLVAFAAAYFVRFSGYIHFDSTDYEPKFYFGLLVLTTVVWSVVTDHYQLANDDAEFHERGNARRILLAYATTYLILFSFFFFFRVQTFSRIFLSISATCLFVGAAALRAHVAAAARRRARARGPLRLFIIGADEHAARVAENLTSTSFPPRTVAAFVQVAGQTVAATMAPVFRASDCEQLVSKHRVDEIVVALPPAQWRELRTLKPLLRMGIPARLALDFGKTIVIRDRLVHIGTVNLASITASPLDDVSYLFLKRGVDVIVAAFAVAFGTPAMVLIAAVIKMTSPGPVLFVQERVGLNGKPFRMYKFRTMHADGRSHADTRWTHRNDARCTRFGALLRRTSLDELPQFFNVLKGDMSVVGPRPERPHFVRQFLQEIASYNARHRLKVGITGWAQVNGLRGDTSIPDRVQYDLYYLKNWSLALDLRIMAMTVRSGFFGKNAY